jgi:hypothetical protein
VNLKTYRVPPTAQMVFPPRFGPKHFINASTKEFTLEGV